MLSGELAWIASQGIAAPLVSYAMSTVKPIDFGRCNKSSAKVASFLVKATMSKASNYSYKDKRTGADVTVQQFETKLVGVNANSYCIGFIKGSKEKCAEAEQKVR